MARARFLWPEFARHEVLATLSRDHRLTFAMLPLFADRQGKLEDRPQRIKTDLFPYDTDIGPKEMDDILGDLVKTGFIVRYEVGGLKCILIPGFLRWQKPHPRETRSKLPNPPRRGAP